MYPILQITSGKLCIDRIPEQDDSLEVSSVMENASEIESLRNIKGPEKSLDKLVHGDQGDRYTPFEDRKNREFRESQAASMQQYREEQESREQDQKRWGELRGERGRQLNDEGLEQLTDCVSRHPISRPVCRSTPKDDLYSSPYIGTDQARLVAGGTWLDGGQSGLKADVIMTIDGGWTKSKAEELQVLSEEIERTKARVEQITKHHMDTRSKAKGQQPDLPQYQLPIIQTDNQPKYKPFGVGDVQALVDKLPPVAEGGALWLSKLDSLTAGQRLALGDFRAVVSRCLTSADVKDIEEEALTHRQNDDTPFTHVSTVIGRAMRIKYPLPNASAMPKLKWDPKQNPREFLDKSKELWLRQTGSHPGKAGDQREWYRRAILEGVPEKVKQAMDNNPDMAGCESTTWEKHLIHHLFKAQESIDEEQDNLKELQSQLLKLQITEAKQKMSEKKKQEKPSSKVMVVTNQPPTPDLYPTPPWVPPPPPQQHSLLYQAYVDGVGRGRGTWGRGRGRGGPPRGPQGRDQCYFCLGIGHWARNCPLRQGSDRRGGRGNGLPPPCGSDTVPCPIEGQCTTH